MLSVWQNYSHQNGGVDDILMFEYANIPGHFHGADAPFELVKTMSFPLFLAISYMFGLSIGVSLFLLWFGAAIIWLRVFGKLTNSKLFLGFVFIFILYCPVAFDNWVGSRLYRNIIFAPITFILLGLLFGLCYAIIKNEKCCRFLILFSLLFVFSYFLNESGSWLYPMLVPLFVSCLYKYLKSRRRIKNARELIPIAKLALVALIPIITLIVSTNIYKAVNYHFFGVYEVETRTNGEQGKFLATLYKFEDPNKSAVNWLTADTITNVWNTLPSLKSRHEILDALLERAKSYSDNNGNIPGDHWGWNLKYIERQFFANAQESEAFYKSVNAELTDAINRGEFHTDNRIYIGPALGRNLSEITSLTPDIINGLRVNLFFQDYSAATNPTVYHQEVDMITRNITYTDNELSMINQKISKHVTSIETGIIGIYQFLMIILLIILMISIALQMACIHKKKFPLFAIISVGLFGYGCAVIFAIMWFSEFINIMHPGIVSSVARFYATNSVPLFMLALLFGALGLIKAYRGIFCSKVATSRR